MRSKWRPTTTLAALTGPGRVQGSPCGPHDQARHDGPLDSLQLPISRRMRFPIKSRREKFRTLSLRVRFTTQARSQILARSSTSFGPGNKAARTHGARSQKTGTDTGSETGSNGLRDEALSKWPHLAEHQALLDRWVTTSAHIAQLRAYLDREGLLDGRGKPRAAATLLRARESDLADAVRLIEAYTPRADEEPWQAAHRRLQARYAKFIHV